ncbi:4'-phosphopantetheinyl transferase family protein [Streptomyces griseoincarnatus]
MLIANVLPPGVAAVESRGGAGPEGALFPEEAALIADSVPQRRAEFTGVRSCARRAMAALGFPPAPVLRGPRGAPLWPEGLVGSMTHCPEYRAAAVAPASAVRMLGIDAEPNRPLPEGHREVVARPAELRRLAAAGRAEAERRDGPHWDRLLFSAKESVFKTWYPLTGDELDFHEAEITMSRTPGCSDRGRFVARLSRSAPGVPEAMAGRWAADRSTIVTAVVLAPG